MLELRNISFTFPENGVRALDGVDFDLRDGEIHGLLGENGAGKSTLASVIAGFQRPAEGTIRVNGKLQRFTSPAAALACGIGLVGQRPALTPGFRIWEDCILGAEGGRYISASAARQRVEQMNEKWAFNLPLTKTTDALPSGKRPLAAILGLLCRDVRVFLLDEPTAPMDSGETSVFFALLRSLRDEGRSVIIISHKLEETLAISNRVTVLRRGRALASENAQSLTLPQVVAMMFGEEEESSGAESESAARQSARSPVPAPRFSAANTRPTLVVRNLSVEADGGTAALRKVSFQLEPGTITAVAGVAESGVRSLETSLAGFTARRGPRSASPQDSEGRIVLCGLDTAGRGYRVFRQSGGVYLGTAGGASPWARTLSIRDNIIIHAHRRIGDGPFRALRAALGLLDRRALDSWTASVLKEAGIEPERAADQALTLSGGQARRVMEAREFAEEGEFILFSESAWGLDRVSRDKLFSRLRSLAAQGRAVLTFFADLDEMLSLCGRIIVLYSGEIALDTPVYGDRALLKKRIQGAMSGL